MPALHSSSWLQVDTHPGVERGLRAAVGSDVGVVRDHNEDAAHADCALGLFIVADGMGGHAAGEVASAIAIAVVREVLEESRGQIATFARRPGGAGRDGIATLVGVAIRAAHDAVQRVASCEVDKRGMGTTLDVVLIAGGRAFVGHVGDSRTYLLRDGRALQITRDHTVAQAMVATGQLSPAEAEVSPLRSVLVNAIGARSDLAVDLLSLPVCAGDRLLLCSDGLHDAVDPDELAAQLVGDGEPALRRVIELCRDRGGHDNITGVVVDIGDDDGGAAVRERDDAPSDGVPVGGDDRDTAAQSGPVKGRSGTLPGR